MHHPFGLQGLQQLQRVAMGFPVVYDNGLVQFLCQLDLTAEKGRLRVFVAGHPVVVQADLAHRYALGVRQQRPQALCVL